jgi:hypothetical protein
MSKRSKYVQKQFLRSVRKRRCCRRHCLHSLHRISLEKEEGIVESRDSLHNFTEGIIHETQSWDIVALEVNRKEHAHTTNLTRRIVVAVASYFGQQGIGNLAGLHIQGTEGVNTGRVLQFGRGRTIVKDVVENNRLTAVSNVGSGVGLNLHEQHQ